MIIRPTGLVDPEIEVRPTKNQVDDLMEEIRLRVEREERVLVTTLTKKMAEDLTDFLLENGFKVRYLHSEVETLERIAILRDLRRGVFDVLVGINLLREGLDLPEVSLVGILDADKEGYLRSGTSLIQTIGRAARNVEGKVIMYADVGDGVDGHGDRRNAAPSRTAGRVQPGARHRAAARSASEVRDILELVESPTRRARSAKLKGETIPREVAMAMAGDIEKKMKEAAGNLEFEKAAALRDELVELRRQIGGNESVLFQGKAPKIFQHALRGTGRKLEPRWRCRRRSRCSQLWRREGDGSGHRSLVRRRRRPGAAGRAAFVCARLRRRARRRLAFVDVGGRAAHRARPGHLQRGRQGVARRRARGARRRDDALHGTARRGDVLLSPWRLARARDGKQQRDRSARR